MANILTAQDASFSLSDLLEIKTFTTFWNNLISDPPQPTRTEVSELLHRYYEDKSSIDTFTSWWYNTSIINKGLIFGTTASVSGLIGMVIGLTIPLIILATGILYYVHKIIIDHEEHRHTRIERFAEEYQALSQQLDAMMAQFKNIQSEMNKALEQVRIQTDEMSKNNAVINEHADTLTDEHKALQQGIAIKHTHDALIQKVQGEITDVISELHVDARSTHSDFNNTKGKLVKLESTLEKLSQTTISMHDTTKDMQEIGKKFKEHVQHAAVSNNDTNAESSDRFIRAIQRSDDVLARARALIRGKKTTNDLETASSSQNSVR